MLKKDKAGNIICTVCGKHPLKHSAEEAKEHFPKTPLIEQGGEKAILLWKSKAVRNPKAAKP